MVTLFCKCRLAQDFHVPNCAVHTHERLSCYRQHKQGGLGTLLQNTTESKYSGYYSKPANRWELVELGHLCSVQQAAQWYTGTVTLLYTTHLVEHLCSGFWQYLRVSWPEVAAQHCPLLCSEVSIKGVGRHWEQNETRKTLSSLTGMS